jgi:recombination protein RecA
MSDNNELLAQLKKKYGKGVVIDAKEVKDKPRTIIPLSPKLDIALSGGIPEGSWVIMSGPSGCGKSTSALCLAGKAQQEEYGSRYVYYLDVEGRLKGINLNENYGLDMDNMTVIQSEPENILSAEDFLNIAMDIIKGHPKCVLIFDSASALCSNREMNEEITANTRASGPKLLSSFCKQMGTVVPIQDSIVIIIQHLIANTSGYGSPFMEDGGRKIEYQADVKLRCTAFAKFEEKENQIGIIPNWQVIKSALGASGQKVKSHIRFGQGIDYVWETIDLGLDFGLIEKGGSWFTLSYLGEENLVKLQGQNKIWAYFQDNKDQFALLQQQIQEMLCE